MMTEDEMSDLLVVLENPIRRRILERLSQETHYPLQLSKELGVSQQAIMKHLKVMEDKGIVRSFEEPSTSGGPARKCYLPTKRVSIRIDMTPSSFQTEVIELDEGKKSEAPAAPDYEKLVDEYRAVPDEDKKGRLQALSRIISEIDGEMEALEARRYQLMNFRERAVSDANKLIAKMNGDYMKRQVLYVMVDGRAHSIDELSDTLDIRMKVLKEMMKDMQEYMVLFERPR